MMNEDIFDSFEEVLELSEDSLDAVTGGKSVTLKVKASEVNVRSGPGTNFGINGRLRRGDKVAYLSDRKKDRDGKTWLYVSNGYINGWIRSDLLKK